MLPSKEKNIYPKSDENLKALIEFYFDKYDIDTTNGVEQLKGKKSLSLNQIEFMLKKLSEAYTPVFQQHLNSGITLSNLIKYGVDALTGSPVNGSKARQKITKEFEQFVIKTESKRYTEVSEKTPVFRPGRRNERDFSKPL